MMRVRIVLAAVFVVLLVGTGAGVAFAFWSATGTAAGTVTLGAVGIEATGLGTLSGAYDSSSNEMTATLGIGNTSPGPIGYSTTVSHGADWDAGLAAAVTVTAWPTQDSGTCTNAASPVSPVSGTWAAPPVITGTLAIGASGTWCVRTGIGSSAIASLAGKGVSASIVVQGSVGSWTAMDTVEVDQTVSSSALPAWQCQDQGYDAVLGWDNPAGAPTTVDYGVYVNGVRLDVGGQPNYYYPHATIDRDRINPGFGGLGTVDAQVRILEPDGSTVPIVGGQLTVTYDNTGSQAYSNRTVVCGAVALPPPPVVVVNPFQCQNNGYYVVISWSNPQNIPMSVGYGVYVNGIQLQVQPNYYYTQASITRDNIQAAFDGTGAVSVEVRAQLPDGTIPLIANGHLAVVFDQWGSGFGDRMVTCG